MANISEATLGSELRDAIRRAQETQESLEITDESGFIIAHIVPVQHEPQDRAWTELQNIIEKIDPYVPEGVDAVQIIRDVRS